MITRTLIIEDLTDYRVLRGSDDDGCIDSPHFGGFCPSNRSELNR